MIVQLGLSFPVFAQKEASGAGTIKTEKEYFIYKLRGTSNDSAIVWQLASYFESEVNKIQSYIKDEAKLRPIERDKAMRSLVYLIKELGDHISKQKIDMYDIPGALESYKNILIALITHKPLNHLLAPLEPRRAQLMASAFSQYKEYSLLDDYAVYKRVSSSPDYILQFLEAKPGFRYSESLLLDAVAYDPLKLVYYLNKNKQGIQDQIRNNENIYIRQVASLSKEKNASELLPFLSPMAENKISADEIIAKRTNANSYFQLLVDGLQGELSTGNHSDVSLKPLRNGIREKALAFYVNQVNEMHTSPDAVRFVPVKGLRAEDLYYIITSAGDELYTSSYLGIFKRLMEHFPEGTADSLFEKVQYDNFHIFIRLAANYNVLDDFFAKVPVEKTRELLKRFITGIENDANTGLDRAMDIADCFSSLSNTPELFEMVHEELQYNMDRSSSSRHYLGIRLYSILMEIFELVKQKEELNRVWAKLGNYEELKYHDLQNEKGDINELVLFYGDEDGIASFNNFQKHYTDRSKWEIKRNSSWMQIRSVQSTSFTIYANLPLDIKDDKDLIAQDSLLSFLTEQSKEPTIIIHRGHSYHLDKTLNRLKPNVRLAVLGSCGGYNKAISIASINPDVQVIGSKKTGSMSINDPVLDMINETIVAGKDLMWPEIWKKLRDRFSRDEVSLSLFNEYFPPSDNLGLFVLKLFNYYNRFEVKRGNVEKPEVIGTN